MSKKKIVKLFALFYIQELLGIGISADKKILNEKSLKLINYYQKEGLEPPMEEIHKAALKIMTKI